MPIGTATGTDAASKLQSTIAQAAQSFASAARPPRAASPAGNPDPSPAAIVQISSAGRAALVDASPWAPQSNPGGQMLRETTTGLDVEYRAKRPGPTSYQNRVYGPGDAHYGSASSGAVATESDPFQTTSPGHKSVGDLGTTLRTAAHEAAHVVQQKVRIAAGDLDGDGRADIAVNGPPSGGIQQTMRARHDIAMNAIRNMKA